MDEKSIRMRLQVVFRLQGKIRRDTMAHVFVADCPALGISSQGENEASAQAALADAVVQTFRFQFDHGKLDDFLLQRGFVTETGNFLEVPPQHGTYEFEVPLLLAEKKPEQKLAV